MRLFSRTTSAWTLLNMSILLSSFLATTNISGSSSSSLVSGAPATGFCAECETYAMVIQPCGGSFTEKDISINGVYSPPESDGACVCKSVIQRLLWNCAKCISLGTGLQAKSPPPQQFQMTCTAWKQPFSLWTSAYTGPVAPGTTSPLSPDNNNPTGTPPPANPSPGTTGGSGNSMTGTGTASGNLPSGTTGDSTSGESSGPNGTAIGISLGIIGIAAVGGAAAVVMMKRRRRRHTPLELDDSYVGLDNQWEKPPRPQSPPMMPAPIASGARAGGGGGGMGRPSPFESRPGNGSVSGGGSVVGGYDNSQYDQYDYHQGGGSTVVGSNYGDFDDGYGKQQQHGGYNQGYGHQGYGHHDQGYPPHDHQGAYNHDYGYDHPVPTSNAPYHGGR
ncbi:hypothetical protein K457DRAFT_126170 [Linnemannia elongata AG-77]|uniref:Uncharacterized protein n=1 Tax=Linnemannia elongata AG-77 TaxID=1314771 RepID=A0A197JY38_9FUNG|nr:hypothetical protein K457DRAFT_126170 [Linnemannia elongata AG-77]